MNNMNVKIFLRLSNNNEINYRKNLILNPIKITRNNRIKIFLLMNNMNVKILN